MSATQLNNKHEKQFQNLTVKKQMSAISYTAVIRGKVIIASYGEQSQKYEKDILRLLPSSQAKTEQKITSGHMYSFVSTPSLIFACVSLQSSDQQRVIQYLDTLSRRWAATLGPSSNTAGLHAMDDQFVKNFGPLIEEYNNTGGKTRQINQQLEETQQILTDTVSKALDRGEELQTISTKSEDLLSTSEEFRTQANNLKRKMRCSYYKTNIIWIAVAILILYLIIAAFCGLTFKSCR